MPKILRISAILCFIVVLASASLIGGVYYWVDKQLKSPIALPSSTSVAGMLYEVNVGQNLTQLSKDLLDRGIIKSDLIYRIGVRLGRLQPHIKAGEYKIKRDMTHEELLTVFQSRSNVQYYLTIPEGLTSYEIVEFLKTQKRMRGVLDDIPAEGSLLPETYAHPRGAQRTSIIERMKRAMADAIDVEWEKREDNLPITSKEEAIILASIVEKETSRASEQARVAGVFINRLNKGMRLQTDPTVIYAITQGRHQNNGKGPLGRRLLRKDLAYPSPYNTYKNAGLPPGPIANPGLGAIKAVLNPEEHDYLYFVADGTGGHAFSKTLDEHNARVAEWRKIRRKKK